MALTKDKGQKKASNTNEKEVKNMDANDIAIEPRFETEGHENPLQIKVWPRRKEKGGADAPMINVDVLLNDGKKTVKISCLLFKNKSTNPKAPTWLGSSLRETNVPVKKIMKAAVNAAKKDKTIANKKA